jgi:hypothetical protein
VHRGVIHDIINIIDTPIKAIKQWGIGIYEEQFAVCESVFVNIKLKLLTSYQIPHLWLIGSVKFKPGNNASCGLKIV